MRSIFLVFFFAASVAFGKQQKAPTFNSTTWTNENHVYFKLIPYGSGLGFAGAYEKSINANMGVGGTLTILPEKNSTQENRPKLISFGGNVFLHFPVDNMDFYVSPGLAVMAMEIANENESTLGATMALGTTVQLTKQFSLGLELSAHQPWFNRESFVASRAYFFNSSMIAKLTF